MKAKPVRIAKEGGFEQCPVEECTHVELKLPGPTGRVHLPVILRGTRSGTGCWTWNGDCEKPTLKPSVKHTAGHFISPDSCWCKYFKEHPEEKPVFHCFLCHTWITDGKAQYLDDCSHELRGQTSELLDVDL